MFPTRSPLLREFLFDDYERSRYPTRALAVAQPMRVHRADWPAPQSFDAALTDLQNVMDSVNEAISHYQSSLAKDTGLGGMKTSRTEDGNLQVALDVSQFKPEEVSVKLCDDNLVIEGKTETSENDSYHKAEFKRWVKLPADVKQEAIKSNLTPDKKLIIEVPVAKPIADSRSRNIPIQVKERPAVESGDKCPAKDSQKQQQQQKSGSEK